MEETKFTLSKRWRGGGRKERRDQGWGKVGGISGGEKEEVSVVAEGLGRAEPKNLKELH